MTAGESRPRPGSGTPVGVLTTDIPNVNGRVRDGSPVHPPPVVPRRPAVPAEAPTSAARLVRAAAAAGWTVALTYARGTRIDNHGRPGAVVDSLAVRLARGPHRAAATWIDRTFAGGWEWRTDIPMIPCAVQYRRLVTRVTAGASGQEPDCLIELPELWGAGGAS